MSSIAQLCLWAALLHSCLVKSSCPPFPGTGGTNIVTVYWTYDWYYGVCPNVTVVGNATCLKFKCDPNLKIYRLDGNITCEPKCTKTPHVAGNCSQPYACAGYVFDEIPEFTYTDWYRYRHGWFSVFSGYTCGAIGSGPCDSSQCFNPLAAPRGRGSVCVPEGGIVYNSLAQSFTCQRFTDCLGNAYVDLVQGPTGCNYEGRIAVEGEVLLQDACNETVCVVQDGVGKVVNRFKGAAGCVFNGKCVGVNQTIPGVVDYVCANLTCRYNASLSAPYVMTDQVDTGCFYETKCFKNGAKKSLDGQCKNLKCTASADTGKHYWLHSYTGCYDPLTNQCSYTNGYTDRVDSCIARTCAATEYGRWKTDYTSSGACIPDPTACFTETGVPGCQHQGHCHPVKSVIPWDGCSQYVCYSDDAGLNRGTYSAGIPLPVWKARPTGCYGPKGCMKFGSQWVDPATLNTYRCPYSAPSLGAAIAEFHKACTAPNGAALQLGRSVKVGAIWYSCYRGGKMLNPLDTSAVFVPGIGGLHTCGENPDTKEMLYQAQRYHEDFGTCWRTGYTCELKCAYFDQPCTKTDLEPFRYLGDQFTLGNAQCLCTQDFAVNNMPIPPTGSVFDRPSLCSQDGVTDGACADGSDGSTHQWREVWTRTDGNGNLLVCGCDAMSRQAFCSDYLPDLINVTAKLQI